jgi:NADH-quinone oxidoreductase subunit J
MAFYLILSLGASAGLFFLAGAEFVGAMQLMIYVGGTLVLLIFGVMLTAQSRFISMKTRSGEWVVALVLGGSLLFLLLTAAFRVEDWRSGLPDPASVGLAESKTTTQIGMGFTGVRVDRLDAPPGSPLVPGMSGYLLPFVIVSVHLLVVLVGAAYMARPKRRAASTGAAA